MKIKWLIVLSTIIALQACGTDDSGMLEPDGDRVSKITLSDSHEQFNSILKSKSGSDFELVSAALHDNYIELNVAYGGGCEDHDFEIIYDSDEGSTGLLELAIIHDNNNDLCEAYLHETIRIELVDIPEIASALKKMSIVRFFNGHSHKSVVIYQGLPSFPESETCALVVTTEDVICGGGLFENRWFSYTPDGSQQSLFLQPVSLAALIQLSGKIEEGNYRIGVKLSAPYVSDPDKVICLVYPGPSVPVEIWCIEKVE